ncbi:MAG: hypothetical protein ACYDEX_13325, partial [Mobilitalea sp.]
ELKFMKVNGIEPTLQTIYDNSYPYINEFYAVVRKDEPADSNAHKIFDWLTGEDGQTLVKDLGYVPVSMNVKEEVNTTEILKEDIIPKGYSYLGTSYSTHDGLYVGTVTIYNNKWEPTRVFHNAYAPQVSGLISEDALLPIGYAVFQKDTFEMQYGIYSLKENKFILPTDYKSLYALDAEKGYYIVNESKGHYVTNLQGEHLTPYFMYGEGFGVSEYGDYYWINDYSVEEAKEKYSIYDSEFRLVNEFYKDYDENVLYDYDGTVYFSKQIFLKHFGYKDDPNDEFYLQSYNYGEQIFSIRYKGLIMIMDRTLNVLAEKIVDPNNNSYYNIYNDIFSDTYYNNDTSTETGLFYDKKGKLIVDKDGNSYSNMISDNYWIGGGNAKSEQVLYGRTDHTVNILRYQDGSQMKIDVDDWENISVAYLYKDIVVLHKMDEEQRTRIYKNNMLLYDRPGLYYLNANDFDYLADRITLVNYAIGVEAGYNYMIINSKGELIYESQKPENVISMDEKYIQLESGNYWCVLDYEGNIIIRAIKNELTND